MTVGLTFLLLCSAAFVTLAVMASYVTDRAGGPLRHSSILSPVALVLATVVVATTLSQWVEHQRDWAVALNRVSFAVLIGGVVGLWSAVWMAGKESWRARIVHYSAYVAANPARAWISAVVLMVAFVAGIASRS